MRWFDLRNLPAQSYLTGLVLCNVCSNCTCTHFHAPPCKHRITTSNNVTIAQSGHSLGNNVAMKLGLHSISCLVTLFHKVLAVSSSSSVAVSVAGVGDHDFPLFAISCIHKHLRSASSQPGCYTVLYFYSLTTSTSFSFDLSCCQQML